MLDNFEWPLTALLCTDMYYLTKLDSSTLHFTAQHFVFPLLQCSALYCIVLLRSVLYCTVLHCTTLYRTVLHCNALHCNALYGTVMHCNTLHSASIIWHKYETEWKTVHLVNFLLIERKRVSWNKKVRPATQAFFYLLRIHLDFGWGFFAPWVKKSLVNLVSQLNKNNLKFHL